MKKKDERIDITIFGAVINILLSFFKIAVGVFSKSRALVADGLHSLSDLISDIIVIFGIVYGDKPSDDDHPYGHKKIETAAEITLGLILAAVAFFIALDALSSLFKPAAKCAATKSAIIVAFASVIVKEYLYQKTLKIGKKYNNSSIVANAWHHRSDALSSAPVVIGLIVIHFFPKL
ncbi:MAG TPA: cation diffusion facilitator family transporter, partial [bacterium]|nr:cation diffusion facilitator family transporter [bacterium]